MLRQLSPAYVEALWNKLAPVLRELDIAEHSLFPGYSHPSYTFVEQATDDPLTYFGWVSRDAWLSSSAPRTHRHRTASRALGAAPPRLVRGDADVRARRLDIAPTSFTAIVTAAAACAVDEVSDWVDAGQADASVLAAEPWRRACRAWRAGDDDALADALRAADAEYSVAGAQIVRAAIARLQDHAVR